jgi:hypothetical protein
MGLGKSEMAARSVQPPAACSTPAGISDQSHRNPHCANVLAEDCAGLEKHAKQMGIHIPSRESGRMTVGAG